MRYAFQAYGFLQYIEQATFCRPDERSASGQNKAHFVSNLKCSG
ncbi:hypothetical protein [Pseudocitrobacter faecalis]